MKIGFIENIVDYADSNSGESMLGWYQLLKQDNDCEFIQWNSNLNDCRVDEEFNREKIAINFIKENKEVLEQYDMLISSLPTTDSYYLAIIKSLRKPVTIFTEFTRDALQIKEGMKQDNYLDKAFDAYDYVITYENELVKELIGSEDTSGYLDKLKSMNILSYYIDPEVLLESSDVLENLPAFAYQNDNCYDELLRQELIDKFVANANDVKSKVVFEYLIVKDKHKGYSNGLLPQAIKSILKGRIPIVNADMCEYLLFEDDLKDYRPLITYDGKEDLFEKIKNFDYEVVSESVEHLQNYYKAKEICKSFVSIVITPDKAFDVYKELYQTITTKETVVQ